MPDLFLSPNPPGCRSLSDAEYERLRAQYPNLWADPSTSCLTCEKTGSFKARVDGGIVTVECDCLSQWRLYRWMLNAGVPLLYQRLTWEDATAIPLPVQMAALQYVHGVGTSLSDGHGLTLWSEGKGSGKTLLAALILKKVLGLGHDGYFIQFNEMLDAFAAGWRSEEERSWFIRRIRNAAILVVDDIGRENRGRSSVAEATFDTVLRFRVSSGMPTIVTTNYRPEQIMQAYGSNLVSLLSEVNDLVEVPGADYRPSARERAVQDAQDGIRRPFTVA